ncbi:DJ-1/PfpI family protein [Photobacterium halotolerans]|uniref:DJ-1/PfpI family protein n=1 Tax=Photobacterium halotolerans TaxID=265726 RepID=A0A7X5AXU2_9GAMM|nr:DJ-1/PfpI family protein [Photobacterium halotolerans]NAW66626.1 DJ-1/PfpI family protein [Photobacterium halotolerans]NAW85024.1 DJ-1/PfpI family protein [Photobacterium halotolerans]NAX47448.1 DJ-1/PfpI family protein [Photobacterium halotolerans]
MTEALAPDKQRGISIVIPLFPDFCLLDVSGPLTLLNALEEEITVTLVSDNASAVISEQGVSLMTEADFNDDLFCDLLLVPGGKGVKASLNHPQLIQWISRQGRKARIRCAVCTGSALLAQAGLLDHKAATTSKHQYHWVSELNHNVKWQPVARWVQDENTFTSSGTAAGLDMSLGLIAFLMGEEAARKVAIDAEYLWRNDPDDDPFAPLHLVE